MLTQYHRITPYIFTRLGRVIAMNRLPEFQGRLFIITQYIKIITCITIIINNRYKNLFQSFSLSVNVIQSIIIFSFMSLLLSGCVKYDVNLTFNHSNSGEFLQHIHLGERITSFGGETFYGWFNSIERSANKLEGKVNRISREEIIIRIPFSNGKELQNKFNSFFSSKSNPISQTNQNNTDSETKPSEIPPLKSILNLKQNNFILIERNHLVYNLDLRSLTPISSRDSISSNIQPILNLEFSLKVPWGINSIAIMEDSLRPDRIGNRLVWCLQTGRINHIEVAFWLPNFLGIGSLFIIFLVLGGIYLRYYYMTPPKIEISFKNPIT
ncbi:hypothetical protein RINTHH_21030 [Richelia intracellularis HH01]|uniref:Uncharacterized protein n=2 Tax=Richelia TaxID=98443 RepID=M1X1K1_9NOST|nr:hypothetical protein RINTHH_21030 [Richelia intracellularis HH01]